MENQENKNRAPSSRLLGTRIDEATHRRLKVYCAINGVKFHQVVNEAIKMFIERPQKHNGAMVSENE